MNNPFRELNIDGLVGPTHNYSGLSLDNVACQTHEGSTSNPKAAALQGLNKAKKLLDLGLPQAVLPPHPRPHYELLRSAGFDSLPAAASEAPHILSAAFSAASMWTANAATVTPSNDSSDQKLHLTPANLLQEPHRFIEANENFRILQHIFADPDHFTVHPPLPSASYFADEGAANHTRLGAHNQSNALHLFVYGKQYRQASAPTSARHTLEASQAIARRHNIDPARTLFAQQNPDAIRLGVFHNDVIAVGNENTLLYHQEAFVNTPGIIEKIRNLVPDFTPIEVPTSVLSIAEAVKTYIFNSQLLTLPDGSSLLLAPLEAGEHKDLQSFLADTPIDRIEYVDVRQSMNNGGGPACLRLRVLLNEAQLKTMHSGVILSETLYQKLHELIENHYPEAVSIQSLKDPQFASDCLATTQRIYDLLQIPFNPR